MEPRWSPHRAPPGSSLWKIPSGAPAYLLWHVGYQLCSDFSKENESRVDATLFWMGLPRGWPRGAPVRGLQCFIVRETTRFWHSRVNIFVAFCSFFPCNLTVCDMGRKQSSGGRQLKSQVDNRKREGRQQKGSKAEKWNDFLIIWPVWVQLLNQRQQSNVNTMLLIRFIS